MNQNRNIEIKFTGIGGKLNILKAKSYHGDEALYLNREEKIGGVNKVVQYTIPYSNVYYIREEKCDD